jgi:hypothetical protein
MRTAAVLNVRCYDRPTMNDVLQRIRRHILEVGLAAYLKEVDAVKDEVCRRQLREFAKRAWIEE